MGESKTFEFAIDQLTQAGNDLLQFAQENPVVLGLSTVTIAGGVATIVVPIAVGFAPVGLVAGSLAAAWMAGIGSVAAGSFFAMLQSLTMNGALLAVGGGMIGIGTAGLMGEVECFNRLQEFAKGTDWKKVDPTEVEWLKGKEWADKAAGEVRKQFEEFGEQTQKGCEYVGEQVKDGCEGATDEVRKGCGEVAEQVKDGCEGAANEVRKGCEDVGEQVKDGCEGGVEEMNKGCDDIASGIKSAFGG